MQIEFLKTCQATFLESRGKAKLKNSLQTTKEYKTWTQIRVKQYKVEYHKDKGEIQKRCCNKSEEEELIPNGGRGGRRREDLGSIVAWRKLSRTRFDEG